MAWTDFFTKELAGSKVVVDSNGKPFVSQEIALKEYVEIELNVVLSSFGYLRCHFSGPEGGGGRLDLDVFGRASG